MGRRGSGCLKRATELFVVDEWGSDSGFVEKAWRSQSEPEPFFISIAAWTNTTIIAGDLVEAVTKLKNEDGKNILIHGYGPIAKTLMRNGLLDESPSGSALSSPVWERPTT